MKALEKAAKDRGEARTEPDTSGAPADSRPELSLALELLAADTPSPRLKEEPQLGAGTAQRTVETGFPRERASAASVMRAGGSAESSIGAYVRDRPLILFGVLAAVFAATFGAYVYLQIFHPGFFIRQLPAAITPAPIVHAPAPAPLPAVPQPIPTAPLLQSTPVTALSQPPEPAPAPAKPVAAAPQKAEPSPPRQAIIVNRGDTASSVNPLLAKAYAALEAGRIEAAAQLYSELARAEPKSIDALLGLAAVAMQEGRSEDARKHYLAILEINPRHALAQSGLIGLVGRADPLAAESHLKQLIAREPSAFLFFTLGNVYADQALWAQAQQAYFQAHHLEPRNPDYAYNLAVGLEHVSQPRLAAGFYRRAVELASVRGQVNFDLSRARERIIALAAQPD